MDEPIVLRRLGRNRRRSYQGHLQRLDRWDRFSRFHAYQPDSAIARHCGTLDLGRVIVIGAFADGRLCGAAELHPPEAPGQMAELAVSVERAFRGIGVGRALFTRALTEAQACGFDRVTVNIFTDDQRMRHIARRFGLNVEWDGLSDGGLPPFLQVDRLC